MVYLLTLKVMVKFVSIGNMVFPSVFLKRALHPELEGQCWIGTDVSNFWLLESTATTASMLLSGNYQNNIFCVCARHSQITLSSVARDHKYN